MAVLFLFRTPASQPPRTVAASGNRRREQCKGRAIYGPDRHLDHDQLKASKKSKKSDHEGQGTRREEVQGRLRPGREWHTRHLHGRPSPNIRMRMRMRMGMCMRTPQSSLGSCRHRSDKDGTRSDSSRDNTLKSFRIRMMYLCKCEYERSVNIIYLDHPTMRRRSTTPLEDWRGTAVAGPGGPQSSSASAKLLKIDLVAV
ncbi:hypothetical protein ANO11243_086290 [Dothideomycetidae sp. 11243]|nr:hypothetical protein ANO11243_086290 [fungal sp. No.11243]